jgi:hypothetical protein
MSNFWLRNTKLTQVKFHEKPVSEYKFDGKVWQLPSETLKMTSNFSNRGFNEFEKDRAIVE